MVCALSAEVDWAEAEVETMRKADKVAASDGRLIFMMDPLGMDAKSALCWILRLSIVW